MPPAVRERRSAREAITKGENGRIQVQLITPGQGSSGYYSTDVLEAAARSRVFPKGTLMFLDHASESEAFDRPERSVKDVGAVLAEDASWDGVSLSAPARLVGPWAETLAEMSDAIGVSISAAGTVTEGQIDGKPTRVVSALAPAVDNSVDFVTYPGRGGSFALLESMRPSKVIERAVRHGVSEATANDTRDALQTAIADRFGTTDDDAPYIWVRDFDESTAWYEMNSTTYAIGYSLNADGSAVLAAGDPTEVTARTTYVPVSPAGGNTTTQESEEDTMPQIEEARLRQLEADAAGRATAEEAQRQSDERAATLQRENAVLRARETARPIATQLVNASETLTASARSRVIDQVVRDVDPGANGQFDEAAFRTTVEAARTQAETELAEALQERGVGSVRNGGGHGDDGHVVTREESDRARAAAFGRPVTEKAGA